MPNAPKKQKPTLSVAELDALSRRVMSVGELNAVAEIAMASLATSASERPSPDRRLFPTR